MNLIDRDALPIGRVEWEDIVEAPTVDAIPTQWLYDLAEQKEKVSAMIKGVVALWHMEQEKQNANPD